MKTKLYTLLVATFLTLPAKSDPIEASIETSVALTWQSELGKTYRIEASDDMETWTTVTASVTGNGSDMTRNFPITAERKFYRVEELEEPAWFVGQWTGETLQSDGSIYQTTLRVDPATGTYTSTYPFCAGRLTPVSVSDTEVVLEEVITQNQANCPFNGRVVVRKLGDDRITYSWSHPDLVFGAFGHFGRK